MYIPSCEVHLNVVIWQLGVRNRAQRQVFGGDWQLFPLNYSVTSVTLINIDYNVDNHIKHMTTIGVHLLFKHEQTHFQLSFLYRPPLEEVWRWADSFEALLSNKCRFTHTHTSVHS